MSETNIYPHLEHVGKRGEQRATVAPQQLPVIAGLCLYGWQQRSGRLSATSVADACVIPDRPAAAASTRNHLGGHAAKRRSGRRRDEGGADRVGHAATADTGKLFKPALEGANGIELAPGNMDADCCRGHAAHLASADAAGDNGVKRRQVRRHVKCQTVVCHPPA